MERFEYSSLSFSMTSFDDAVAHVRSIPKGESTLTQAQQLAFYANFKQATVGTCKAFGGSQPWAVQLEARAKWDAWNALGEKSADEAKTDDVKMLTEAIPGWSK